MKIILKIVADSAKDALSVVSDVQEGRLPVEIRGQIDGIEIVQSSLKINLSQVPEVRPELLADAQS